MGAGIDVRSGVPTAAELIERIDAIRPVLEGNAAKTESERRVAEENIDALKAAGAFRVMIPRRFGGYQMTVREKLEVSAAVAESCGSTAWVVSLTNVNTWIAGLLPKRAQDEIFGANPDVRMAGVLNPAHDARPVEGGYVISGRWPFASGVLHADWFLAGFDVVDEDRKVVDQAIAFCPIEELSIEDTWFVAGMRGTGSNTVVAEEVFVPEHRVCSVTRALDNEYETELGDEEELYRSSFMPILAVILLGPQIGLGRAALNLVVEKASKRGVTYTRYERQNESTAFQLQIARAKMLIDTAELLAFRTADGIDAAAAAGEKITYELRARARADAAYGTGRIRDAIDLLISAHGAASFADSSPLQRIWRDSNTAGRHAIVDEYVNLELYGKALLEIPVEENITQLI